MGRCRVWLLMLVFASAFGACADPAFEQAFDEVKARAGQPDFLVRLVALDQRFPDRLALKVDLGAAYLQAGEGEGARAYLDRGAELAAFSGDEGLKGVRWANLAQAALMGGDGRQAIDYADRALSRRDGRLGVIFTRAKAKLLTGDGAGALADFETGWQTRRETMVAQDFGLFARTLVAAKNFALALEVLEAYRNSFPYEPGTGLLESLCYENLGRPGEAVVAAYVDVNYRLSRGLVEPTQVLTNLRALEAEMQTQADPAKSGLVALQSVEAWSLGRWSRVSFDPGLLEASADACFLHLAALVATGGATGSDLKAYLGLEPRFRDFPSYYLPLLLHRSITSDAEGNPGVREMAERVVNLAPQGPAAREGRAALAKEYGLPPASAEALLTRVEVDQALARGDLSRVLSLLGLPDNPSTQQAVDRLTSLVRSPAWRTALTSLQSDPKAAPSRAKERLNLVLANR